MAASNNTNTTFVQADPSTFRAVVQKLTGAAEDPSAQKLPVTVPARLAGKSPSLEMGPRRPSFKLQERRQSVRKLEITRHRSFLGFNGDILMASPVSPLDLFSACPKTPSDEEERAIAEKGFYLHPSPLNTPRSSEPELLPLFPLHSPRDNDEHSSSP